MRLSCRAVVRYGAWVPAVALFIVGLRGIAPVYPSTHYTELGLTLLQLPHLVGAAVVVWGGRVGPAAFAVALLGAGAAAAMPWVRQAGQATEGHDIEVGNLYVAGMCCLGSYGFVAVAAFGVLVASVAGKERERRRAAASDAPAVGGDR